MFDVTDGKAGSVIEAASINPDEKTDLTTWFKMVEQLRHAPEWPEDELPIEMKQTHISVLLLSRNHVIKLKKPVDFGFLDYTTLNKRLKACEDEVRLNRRLCPDIYIGVGGVSEVDGQIRLSSGYSLSKRYQQVQLEEAKDEKTVLPMHTQIRRYNPTARLGVSLESRHSGAEAVS